MPINRDDIIGEVNVSGSSGITCKRVRINIDPISRALQVEFVIVKITVLQDNTLFEVPCAPIVVDLADGTGTKYFDLYNRRTGNKLGSGQSRLYDQLSRDIMSLFFDSASKQSIQ